MRKFIVINGTKAWICERKTLADAVQSAQNICDHSKEVIVREVKQFTDYSRIYHDVSSL